MPTIIFNKEIISTDTPCIRHNDRGFTLGHGLFETILIKNNSFPVLDYHWKRLVSSAPLLGISLPFSKDDLEFMLNTLININKLENVLAGARVTITQGEASRGLLPLQEAKPNFVITVFEHSTLHLKPYSALIVTTRKNEHSLASQVKSLSYLDNILAKQEAAHKGYDEAILLNSASNIADGAISNIFMVKGGLITTPPIADGALPGVIRAILLEEFSQNFSIVEQSINPSQLMQADEIFLTNALMGVKPIYKLDNQSFSVFPVANALNALLREEKNYI